jgi:hypothetical protein
MWTFVSVEDPTPAPENMAVDILAEWIVRRILSKGGEPVEIKAKGICPICFEPVWPEDESVFAGGKTYHSDCHRQVEARVETLTRHVRKARKTVRNARLTKAVGASG